MTNDIYTVYLPGGNLTYVKGENGVNDIYEPDPRNMEGGQFFTVTFDSKSITFHNATYTVSRHTEKKSEWEKNCSCHLSAPCQNCIEDPSQQGDE